MKPKNQHAEKVQNLTTPDRQTEQTPQRQPSASIIKVKSKIKAGYYLSFTIGAGASTPAVDA